MPKDIDIPLPDLTGRLTVVTGASDGVGFEIAARLARSGADLVLPVRNPAKGEAAAERIGERTPGAGIRILSLDLASLESVSAFAEAMLDDGRPIDILIANAGIMTPPTRQVSHDGHELQLATNHLGHFALVAQLLPLLIAGRAHVTSQVSVAADQGAINWDDLDWERGYDAMKAYSSSKIAFGLFATELQRRSDAAGWGLRSNLSHPGVTPTNLLAAQPGMGRPDDTAADSCPASALFAHTVRPGNGVAPSPFPSVPLTRLSLSTNTRRERLAPFVGPVRASSGSRYG